MVLLCLHMSEVVKLVDQFIASHSYFLGMHFSQRKKIIDIAVSGKGIIF